MSFVFILIKKIIPIVLHFFVCATILAMIVLFFWQRAPFNILFNTRQLPTDFSDFVWRISIFVFEKYFPWH